MSWIVEIRTFVALWCVIRLFSQYLSGDMRVKDFKIVPFLTGLAAGLVVLVFFKGEKRVVYEYPHPDKKDARIYRDSNGICYKYNVSEVDCDKNEATLKQYPIQS